MQYSQIQYLTSLLVVLKDYWGDAYKWLHYIQNNIITQEQVKQLIETIEMTIEIGKKSMNGNSLIQSLDFIKQLKTKEQEISKTDLEEAENILNLL